MTAFYLRADRVYTEDGVVDNALVGVGSNGLITAITDKPDSDVPVLAQGQRLIPGLIDLHVHGRNGADVMDARPDTMDILSQALASRGVTGFLGTTVTASWQETLNAVAAVADGCERQLPGARALGCYSEGLFFTPKHKGAHNEQYFLAPDKEKLQEMITHGRGHLKVVALAPELAGAEEVIRWLKEQGVKTSLGHCEANFEQTCSALDAGASSGVHIFNGMEGLHHREPGCSGALLYRSDAYVELIADGIHVHPAVLNLIARIKGADKVSLISDCMRAGGLPDGEYLLGTLNIEVKNGIARSHTGSLAGSTLGLDQAVANMISLGEVPEEDAIKMASLTPARFLGLDHDIGSIRVGKKANLVLVDDNWNVEATWVDGLQVFNNQLKK